MPLRPAPTSFLAIGLGLLLAAAGCTPAADDASGAGGQGGAAPGGSGGAGTGGRGGAGGATGGAGAGGATGGAGPSSGGSGAGGAGGGTAEGGAGGAAGGAGGSAGAPDAGTQADAGGTGAEAGAADGKPGAFPPGPHKVVLLVGDTNVRDQSRLQLIDILTAMKATHGIELEVMQSQQARAANLADRALIIAGPNNNYCTDTPDAGFRTLPVPIIVSRDCKTTAFGLATMMNTQEYVTGLPVKVVIENNEHPLAAGLAKGTIPVLETRCRLVRGRDLGPDAIKIARPPADATPAAADSWAIFAYDKGGKMAGGLVAPAKRMGFFWHRPSAVTPEGKKLFIAAIEWALTP